MSSVCMSSYASLYFVACVDKEDNELITLEKIHLFVEILDRYFGNVRKSPSSFPILWHIV